MPEAEDIVQRIALSGQDEVIAAFGEIGKAGEEALKHLADAAGPLGKVFAGITGGFTALIGVTGLWAHHASEAVHHLELLATQAGETVESISALEGAMAAMGGSTEGLGNAFRRMGTTITREWQALKKEIAGSADVMIGDQLKVEKAEETLFQARQKRMQAFGAPGADPETLRIHAQRTARREEAEAAEALHLAEKKRAEDRLNQPQAYLKAVRDVIGGEKDFAEASKAANLSVEHIIKGLIGNTEGAEDALKNFHGSINDIIGEGPQIKEVFYNLADFLKNSGNAALNNAVMMRLLGRTVGSEMIVPLSKGSEAIKENEKAMQRHGLVIDEEMVKPAKEFHEAYNRLAYDLSTTTNKIGLMFAPAFTTGMQDLTRYLEENHDAIMKWASDLVSKVTPYIQGFFDALKGLAAYLAGDQLKPGTNAAAWEASWARIGRAVTTVAEIIKTAIKGITTAMSEFSGATGLKPFEAVLYGIAGLAAWKVLGGTIGKAIFGGIAAEITGGLALLIPGLVPGAVPRGAPGTAAPGARPGAVPGAPVGRGAGPNLGLALWLLDLVKGKTQRDEVRRILKEEYKWTDSQIEDFLSKPIEEQHKILDTMGVPKEGAAERPRVGPFPLGATPKPETSFSETLRRRDEASRKQEEEDERKKKEDVERMKSERERKSSEEEQKRKTLPGYRAPGGYPFTEDERRAIEAKGGPGIRVVKPLAEYTEEEKRALALRGGPGIRIAPETIPIPRPRPLEEEPEAVPLPRPRPTPETEIEKPATFEERFPGPFNKSYIDEATGSVKKMSLELDKTTESLRPVPGTVANTTESLKTLAASKPAEEEKVAQPTNNVVSAMNNLASATERLAALFNSMKPSGAEAGAGAGAGPAGGATQAAAAAPPSGGPKIVYPPETTAAAAGGGAVGGFGSGTSDNVPIMASVGEFVVRADGSNLRDAIKHFTGYQAGGEVENVRFMQPGWLEAFKYGAESEVKPSLGELKYLEKEFEKKLKEDPSNLELDPLIPSGQEEHVASGGIINAIKHFTGYQKGGKVRRRKRDDIIYLSDKDLATLVPLGKKETPREKTEREKREKEQFQHPPKVYSLGPTTDPFTGLSKQRAAAQKAYRARERYESMRGIGGVGGGPYDPWSPQPPGYESGEPYAEGGVVSNFIRGFANGGLVGGIFGSEGWSSAQALMGEATSASLAGLPGIGFPGIGTLSQSFINTINQMVPLTSPLTDAVASALGSALGKSMGYYNLDLRTSGGTFSVYMNTQTLEAIRESAIGGKLSSTGSRPSWFS